MARETRYSNNFPKNFERKIQKLPVPGGHLDYFVMDGYSALFKAANYTYKNTNNNPSANRKYTLPFYKREGNENSETYHLSRHHSVYFGSKETAADLYLKRRWGRYLCKYEPKHGLNLFVLNYNNLKYLSDKVTELYSTRRATQFTDLVKALYGIGVTGTEQNNLLRRYGMTVPNATRKPGYNGRINRWSHVEGDKLLLYMIYSLLETTIPGTQGFFQGAIGGVLPTRHANQPGRGFHSEIILFDQKNKLNIGRSICVPARKIAIMFLGGVPKGTNNKLWAEFLTNSKGRVRIFIHPKNDGNIPNVTPLHRFDPKAMVLSGNKHLRTAWGNVSLPSATLLMLQEAFKDDSVFKFVLVDANHIPIRNFNEFYDELTGDNLCWIRTHHATVGHLGVNSTSAAIARQLYAGYGGIKKLNEPENLLLSDGHTTDFMAGQFFAINRLFVFALLGDRKKINFLNSQEKWNEKRFMTKKLITSFNVGNVWTKQNTGTGTNRVVINPRINSSYNAMNSRRLVQQLLRRDELLIPLIRIILGSREFVRNLKITIKRNINGNPIRNEHGNPTRNENENTNNLSKNTYNISPAIQTKYPKTVFVPPVLGPMVRINGSKTMTKMNGRTAVHKGQSLTRKYGRAHKKFTIFNGTPIHTQFSTYEDWTHFSANPNNLFRSAGFNVNGANLNVDWETLCNGVHSRLVRGESSRFTDVRLNNYERGYKLPFHHPLEFNEWTTKDGLVGFWILYKFKSRLLCPPTRNNCIQNRNNMNNTAFGNYRRLWTQRTFDSAYVTLRNTLFNFINKSRNRSNLPRKNTRERPSTYIIRLIENNYDALSRSIKNFETPLSDAYFNIARESGALFIRKVSLIRMTNNINLRSNKPNITKNTQINFSENNLSNKLQYIPAAAAPPPANGGAANQAAGFIPFGRLAPGAAPNPAAAVAPPFAGAVAGAAGNPFAKVAGNPFAGAVAGAAGNPFAFGLKKGGQVKKTNVYKLHKGEMVVKKNSVKKLDKLLKKPLKKKISVNKPVSKKKISVKKPVSKKKISVKKPVSKNKK